MSEVLQDQINRLKQEQATLQQKVIVASTALKESKAELRKVSKAIAYFERLVGQPDEEDEPEEINE